MDAELVVSFVIGGGCAVMFAAFVIQLRRGKWLNLIAGNYFVTKEEAKTPEQRLLGRRVSNALVPAIPLSAFIPLAAMAETAGVQWLQTACLAAVAASTLALVATIAHLFVIYRRETRDAQEKLLAEDPSKEGEVRLDRLQTRVIYGFLLFMLAIYLGTAVYTTLSS